MTALKDQLKLQIETGAARNPVLNPTGEAGVAGWYLESSSGSGTIALDTANSPVAVEGRSFKLGGTPSAVYLSCPIAVVPGDYMGAAASFYRPAGGNVGASLAVTLYFYDSAGNWLNNVSPPTASFTLNATAQTQTVTLAPVVVPADSAFARIRIGVQSSTNVWFGKVTANRAATALAAAAAWVDPTYTDVIGTSMSIHVEQGNELDGAHDTITPGLLTAVVNDATIDPANNAQVYRGCRIRLLALVGTDWVAQFTGNVEVLKTNYVKGHSIVTVSATDAAAALTRTASAGSSSGAFASGYQAFQHVLNYQAATEARVMTLDASINFGTAYGLDCYLEGSTIADWLERTCNTVGAAVWVDKTNAVQGRLIADLPTASTTLSDNPADVGATFYTDIDVSYSSEALVNSLTVKRINLDEPTDGNKVYGPYQAVKSIDKWGIIPAEIEVMNGIPATIAAARLQTFATPEVYPRSITFNATFDISKATSLALYQKILVKRAALINKSYRLIKISHDITAKNVGTGEGGKWITKLELRPVETGQPAVTIVSPLAGSTSGPEDTLPFTLAAQTGEVSITPTTINVPKTAPVLFNKKYNVAPRVFPGLISSVPGTAVTGVAVTNVTATGFDMVLTRNSLVTTRISWLALP